MTPRRPTPRPHRRAAGRRSRLGRGRWLLGVAGLVLAAAAPAGADSSQPVVQATVYPGNRPVTTTTVTLGKLDTCPAYSGSNPVYTHPADQPQGAATGSSWALETVITCGLSLPLGDVSELQVEKQNATVSFESPLSNADLSDSAQYHDPQAPAALPFVSVDGGQDQTTYVRPWRGGTDDNGADVVVAIGAPIDILVFENGPPLSVKASYTDVSHTSTALVARLRAVVRDAHGSVVPPGELRWTWDFDDGTTSTAATPQHSFAQGAYPVTVQVTDEAAGTGGVGSTEVTFNLSTTRSPGNHPGAGHHRTGTPSGPADSSGTHPGQGAGRSKTTASHTQHTTKTTPSSTTSTTTTTTSTTTTPAPSTTTSPHRAAPPRRARAAHHTTPPAPSGPVISGRLISDVTTTAVLPTAASPVVAADASAPPVRSAGSTSALSAILGGLAALALFGGGAAREWLGRPGARRLRLRLPRP